MNTVDKNKAILKQLTLFFGIFLLFTDVFFLIIGVVYDFPLIRYVIYVKLVINTTNLFIILKEHYLVATSIIYTVILGFMITGVVSLGIKPAFQLYGLGMIACVSYNGYLHKRVLKKELSLPIVMTIHVLCYAGVYLYARFNEPLYNVPRSALDILISFNSLATFSMVILYIGFFHHVALDSEEKLENMALIDNLTGLYNRHYLLRTLDQMKIVTPKKHWLALLDIDNFKMINDTYGHLCGDYILRRVSDISKQECKDCIVCRWGGEEFIILPTSDKTDQSILDKLRRRISDENFVFENNNIHITVTIGSAFHNGNMTHDIWISEADKKLYYGKENGKDQVVV